MSVSVLFLLSLARQYSFVFPFKQHIIAKQGAVCLFSSLTIVWTITGHLLFQNLSLQLVNTVCFIFEFPVLNQKTSYSTHAVSYFVFTLMSVNIEALSVILILNIWCIKIVTQSSELSNKKRIQATSLMIKTIIISQTEFIGWSVIFPVAVLSFAGVIIDATVLSWIAVVGFPSNAVLNPVLYTFSTTKFHSFLNSVLLFVFRRENEQ